MRSLIEEKNNTFRQGLAYEKGYEDIIRQIKEEYEKRVGDGIGQLLYSQRRLFYSSGDRSVFEKTYFGRRHLLDTAALLALIYPDKEEYLVTAEDCIMAVCEEYGWALPAHTDGTLVSDTTTVDLFASETAMELAEIVSYLGDRLDSTVKTVAINNVITRVFDNYENRVFRWEEGTNNWSSVCSGSVGCAMMYLDPQRFERLLPRILHTMECFISGFTDDGTCLEGVAYWHYGFSAFVWFADMLYRYTDGKTDLLENEKVKKCAEYMQRNFLVGDTTVSFADGSTRGKSGYGIQYFLHKRYPDTVTLLPKKFLGITGNSYWLNMSRALFYYTPDNTVDDIARKDYHMPLAGQYVASRDNFSFAIKAGHNNEPHNHNDVGSFIISSQKGHELCDIGSGLYTRQYFRNETRYGIFCNRSMGHSVPMINGCEQKFGAEYKGTMAVENNVVTVELSGAYGIKELSRFTRRAIISDNGVTLTDSWEGDVTVTERFITTVEPKTDMGCVRLNRATIEYPAGGAPRITEEKHYNHDASTGYTTVYCIDLDIPKNTRSAEFKISIQ